MTLSTTDFLNLYRMSTWEVFEKSKHNPLIPNLTIGWSQMWKWILTSWGLNTLITGSNFLET